MTHGDDDDDAFDEPDVEGPEPDLMDFEDGPVDHLDDEAYDEFVALELDDEGRMRREPPVLLWIVLLTVGVLAVALLVLR